MTPIQFIVPVSGALIFSLLLIPVLRRIAIMVGMVDKPNARKVHSEPVPLVGGISIAIATWLALLSSPVFKESFQQNTSLLIGGLIMLIVGALDDRLNIKPVYRLLIQFGCAFAVAFSGIRITSLHGLVGITEIPIYLQYGLTIIVITGVVNAYNLMDGIDGLIGGLTFVAAAVLGVISYQLGLFDLTVLCLAITGAIVGFLRYNLSRRKIFMGDAGSLLLGFVLVVTAIRILNSTNEQNPNEQLKILLLIAGIFLVPVFDSLRVYRARIKRGVSPFKADKTHLHHLFLFLGITHRKATILIVILVLLITLIVAGLVFLIPAIWVIAAGVFVFASVAVVLTLNRSVQEWRERLKDFERA